MTDHPSHARLDARIDRLESQITSLGDQLTRGQSQVMQALIGSVDAPGGIISRIEKAEEATARLREDVTDIKKAVSVATWLTSIPQALRKPLLLAIAVMLGSGPAGVFLARAGADPEDVARALLAIEVEVQPEPAPRTQSPPTRTREPWEPWEHRLTVEPAAAPSPQE